MKIDKFIHAGYKEYQNSRFPIPQCFGKYQYVCSSKKGMVSLIHLFPNSPDEYWEIYSLQGELFEDVIRYSTKDAALSYVKTIL